jgi:hypothetical protein
LYVTPVFYIYFDKLQGRIGRFFGNRRRGKGRKEGTQIRTD